MIYISYHLPSLKVNIPLQICRDSQLVEKCLTKAVSELEISIEYVSVPEGTGRMMEMLESEEIDLALAVTGVLIRHIYYFPCILYPTMFVI